MLNAIVNVKKRADSRSDSLRTWIIHVKLTVPETEENVIYYKNI